MILLIIYPVESGKERQHTTKKENFISVYRNCPMGVFIHYIDKIIKVNRIQFIYINLVL